MGERVDGTGSITTTNVKNSVENKYELTLSPKPGAPFPKESAVQQMFLDLKAAAAPYNVELIIK